MTRSNSTSLMRIVARQGLGRVLQSVRVHVRSFHVGKRRLMASVCMRCIAHPMIC